MSSTPTAIMLVMVMKMIIALATNPPISKLHTKTSHSAIITVVTKPTSTEIAILTTK